MTDQLKEVEPMDLIDKVKKLHTDLIGLKSHLVQSIIRLDERIPVDRINQFIELLRKPMDVNDKSIIKALEDFKQEAKRLAEMDVSRITSELKFIGKKVDEVDQRLKAMEKNGIPSHAEISITLDGRKMIKAPINFDSIDEEIQKMEENKDPFLDKLMDLLDDEEKRIVCMRIGLCGHKIHTYKEISEVIGMSYDYARKVFRRALFAWARQENKKILKKIGDATLRGNIEFLLRKL